MRDRRLIPVLLAAAALSFCSDSVTGPTGTGTLQLNLTDSPFSDAESVLITFSTVQAFRDDAEAPEPVPFADHAESRTCDLKKLVGAQDVLGAETLPSGHYTQLRLGISSAAIYFDNEADGAPCAPSLTPPEGAMAVVEVPSGVIKLNRPFDLFSGGGRAIVLDFDGDQSIIRTGNGDYALKPVITVASVR